MVDRDVLVHPFTLVHGYARHPRPESQAVPIILLGDAGHLVTSMEGSHTWCYHLTFGHLFFQREPKTHHFPGVPPPPPSSHFIMKNHFCILKLLRMSQWIEPGINGGSTETISPCWGKMAKVSFPWEFS